MKIALYIEDGLEQIVLTPESDTEKSLLNKMHDPNARTVQIKKGGFYECRGGFVRQDAEYNSTMIVLRPAPAEPTTEPAVAAGGGIFP